MSDNKSLERDTESRNRIVSDIYTNFFVEAGAGSGKTTMLVSRMVAMVEAGIPIGKICAITFTKAAAGEFYDRFQKLLIERSNPDFVWVDKGYAGQLPKPTEKSMALCAEALKNIDLCFMGTIDSFCSMVLSEHPSEARIPSDVSLMSEDDAQIFYQQMYVKICAGECDRELADMASTFRSLYYNAEEVFVKCASVFMNNRNVTFNFPVIDAVDIDTIFKNERNELIRAIQVLVNHPEIKYPSEQKNLAAWDRIEDTFKNLRKRWSSNFSIVMYAIKSLKDIRILPDAVNTYGASLSGLFAPGGAKGAWMECSAAQDDGLLSKMQNIQYSLTMQFAHKCIPILETAMRDKGNMTFFDYLYYLREMLKRNAGNGGKLIRYIYDRHSYFLIDEFQDTNPMQAEVFFYLSSERPVPQWSACVPRPGSLFIVGDPKQSIYRFRSADVTSFLKVKGLFEKNGGSILSLSRNFRSVNMLCDYFNKCFTQMLPEETEDQSKFEEIPLPEAKDDEFQGIFTYTAYTGALADANPEETDPVQLAKIIDTLVDRDEYLIRTGDDKEPRKIRYSDIMVITYGKSKLGPLMMFLDSKGIPTRVEGEVPFDANEALFEVFKIYSAVADTRDAISLYGALTGKLIGLTQNEILKFKECGGRISLKSSFDTEECDDKTVLLVWSKIEELKTLHVKAMRLSPAALFAKIMDDYRVYKIAEAENLEVVYYTLELMRNAEKSGLVVSLKDGADYITQLIAGASGEERCLSLNDSRDAVHMANLHKVKGLEAPVVILSSAVQFVNNSDMRIVHGDDGSKGYFFKLSKGGNSKGSYFETADFSDEKEEEKASGRAENQRLVYVAATRARNALIICDSVMAGKNGEVHRTAWKPVKADDLPDFFSTMGEKEDKKRISGESADSVALYKEAEETCVLNDRSSEEVTYYVENPSRAHLSSKMSDEQLVNVYAEEDDLVEGDTDDAQNAESSEIRQKTSEIHIFPALLGTMTHKLMEMLVSTKNQVDSEVAVKEIIREFRTPGTEPYEKELTSALSGVAKTMRSGGYEQTNGLPADILSALLSADEVYCEVPFCYADDGENGRIVWNGIMDVVYCSRGKWHIVDYKTNADGSDLDKKYKAQLLAYINAFKATTGEDADALTYHIDV